MLVSGPVIVNNIKYVGFSGVHTCFGLQIQHVASGVSLYIHLSKDLVIRRAVKNIFKEFKKILAQNKSKEFSVRIVGGYREQQPDPLGPDISTILFYFFIVRFLAGAKKKKINLNILSVDCFEKLEKIRQYNEKNKYGDLGVGCLFERDGTPVLFHYPTLLSQPFNTIGNAFTNDMPCMRYYVWSRVIGTLGYFDKDIVLFYNDVNKSFKDEFDKKCHIKFREAFISKIMTSLLKNKLIYSITDPFVMALLDTHLDD